MTVESILLGSSVPTEVNLLRSNLRMRYSVHSSDSRQVVKKYAECVQIME